MISYIIYQSPDNYKGGSVNMTMGNDENRIQRYAAACILAAFGGAVLWLAVRVFLPVVLPVGIGSGQLL